jgi:sugar-specific transcriptional regulator TrmB
MLQKRGVVSTYFENKRTVYVPEDPKRIIDYFAEKQEVARNVVTKLKQQNSAQNSQTIKLFRGYKGAKSVFQEILDICKRGSTYYVLGSQGQFSEHMQNYAQLFSKLKIEKGIRTKMLRRTHKDKVGKLTDYKIVPSDVDSPATINIYAGKVSIFIWEEVPQVIVIDNPQVARTFENYFKFMWKHARQ